MCFGERRTKERKGHTVFHELGHADEHDHGDETHENHRVLEDGEDGDCSQSFVSSAVVRLARREQLTLRPLHEIGLGSQRPQLNTLAAATLFDAQLLTLVSPISSPESLPRLDLAIGENIDSQRLVSVARRVDVHEVGVARRDVVEDEGVDGREGRAVPRVQGRESGVRVGWEGEWVGFGGEVERQRGGEGEGDEGREAEGDGEVHGLRRVSRAWATIEWRLGGKSCGGSLDGR